MDTGRAGRIIDWFIPDDLRGGADAARRARVLVVGCLGVGLLAALVRAVRMLSPLGEPLPVVAVGGTALILLSPFVLKWTGSLRLAGAIPVAVLLAVVPLIGLGAGGLLAPGMLAAPVLPVLATFFLGARMGVVTAAIMVGELAFLGWLHASGYGFESPIPPERLYIFKGSVAAVAVTMMAFLAWLYERERVAAEQKLREEIEERLRAERIKDDFVSMVSHELRTPLTSVHGSLRLLASGVVSPADGETRELLELAERNSRRLLLLVNDLLDMRAIHEGHLSLDHDDVDLVEIVRETVGVDRSVAESAQTEFRVVAEVERALVRGDRQRLQQVLSNLLSNAAKYSPAGEPVEVRVARRGDAFRTSVSDRGPGIPESFRPRVFERFAQAEETTTRTQAGSGLGLSIARALVEAHGGTIGFDSRPGEGTTFFFDIPARQRGPRTF